MSPTPRQSAGRRSATSSFNANELAKHASFIQYVLYHISRLCRCGPCGGCSCTNLASYLRQLCLFYIVQTTNPMLWIERRELSTLTSAHSAAGLAPAPLMRSTCLKLLPRYTGSGRIPAPQDMVRKHIPPFTL